MTEPKLTKEELTRALNQLSEICNNSSAGAGWWNCPETGEDLLSNPSYAHYVVATKMMLIVSEIAEAMEGYRKDLMDDKVPDRQMIEVELADSLIRIFDLAGKLGLDLGGATMDKMDVNTIRPDHKVENRRKKGGKKF